MHFIFIFMAFLLSVALVKCETRLDYRCFQPLSNITEKLSNNLALKDAYTMVVRASDFKNNITAEIKEAKFNGTIGIIQRTRWNKFMQWIYSKNDTIFYNDSNCSVSNGKEIPFPYLISHELVKVLHLPNHSINIGQMLSLILTMKMEKSWMVKNSTFNIGGRRTVQWVGCTKPDEGVRTEIQVAFVEKMDGMKPSDSEFENPALLQVIIKQYDGDNASTGNIREHISFDVNSLHIPTDKCKETLLLPPRGVFCEGMKGGKKAPVLPRKFEADLQYMDVEKKRIDTVIYDGDHKIVSYSLDATLDVAEPFLGNISVGVGHVTVVHDFTSGLQFVLTGSGDFCRNVSAIPTGAGDAVFANGQLKNATEFLLGGNQSQFVHVGQRYTDDGMPADVFVGRSAEQRHRNDSDMVNELWYTVPNWTIENKLGISMSIPVLHEIRQYYTNGHNINVTVQKFHSFIDFTNRTTSWSRLSIYPCLNLSIDSYLYISIQQTSMKDIGKVGVDSFECALTEELADIADVSPLRLARFFVREIEDNLVAFFVIGEAAGMESEGRNETKLNEARDRLNRTLEAGPIQWTATGKDGTRKTFTLEKQTLGNIPSQWTPYPSIVHSGYGGGSVFLLSVFMLLMGSGAGIGGAYFMWKRHRFGGGGGSGGLSYQVFE